MPDDELRLRFLVGGGQLEEAADLCRNRLHDDTSGTYWLQQLGFVCFLNDGNDTAYYGNAVEAFREFVRREPGSADARFWLGYVREVALHDHAGAEEALEMALRILPEHPYAHLVLAGLKTSAERVAELEATLAVQSGNLRAWRNLAEELERQQDSSRARRAYEKLLDATPYVEIAYGIMNSYMNEVLTGASHSDTWKREARHKAAKL